MSTRGWAVLTDRLPAILRLEAEGHPGLREQFWELARAASERDMPKDIATQMAGIWPWLRVRTTGCRLATDAHGITLFVSRL